MGDSRQKGSILPTMALLVAVVFWGSSFSIMKVSIHNLGPWAVMWARMAVALIVILPFWRKIWPLPYRPGDWKLLLPMCLFEPCLYFTLEANALRFTSSSQAGLIAASVPLMVAFAAHFVLGERVSKWTVTGLVAAIGGVAWLTLAGDPSEVATNPLLGNALEMGAMISAVGYIGALVYLGVCVTLGAFGFYNYGIAHVPANRASAFINIIPVVAVIFGWTLLGETLNGGQIAAAFCVLAGVWLSQWGSESPE